MSHKLQPVRGTHDILPEEFEKFSNVVSQARDLGQLFGFQEMVTPIFEATEVFARSMGETSDVVSKEMYTFNTKGDESVTLRPEFTAGIARAFISNGMQQDLPLKLFSTGPLFRYERPQKGRQRQFHQVNFEWLGDDSPQADIELIMLASRLLFVLSGKMGCTLHINTLGDKESRARYRDALVEFLTPFSAELSEDSQRRLVSNPLRILDSKSEQDKAIISRAPKITDFLSENSKNRFETVCRAIEGERYNLAKQELVRNPALVRGLDYYTDIVFEFVGEIGDLGAQSTVLAGGRYDGLIEQMGGKSTPAVGFAAGVERLMLLTQGKTPPYQPDENKIFVLPLDESVPQEQVHVFVDWLRLTLFKLTGFKQSKHRIAIEILWQGAQKKRMEKANKRGATHVVLMQSEGIQVKNMKTGEQQPFNLEDMLKHNDKLIPLFNLFNTAQNS